MSDLTTYLGNKICRWLDGSAMPTAPTALFLALYDGDPKGAGVEITENVNYHGRQAISWTALSVGTDHILASDTLVDFGLSESAVNLTHVAVFDDGGAGDMLATKVLAGGPYTVTVGTRVEFPAADLNFTIGS